MKPLVVSKCENMDTEQNPGPSNHINLQENASVLLQRSIHQRDEIFSHDSRGRQCLPCCLVFLVKAVQKRICTNMWNVNMNEILFAGDKLYKYAKKNSKTYHDYLEPCDLPSFFIHLTTSIITGKWKKKYHILSGVSFPWFRDNTRYDFLIQPIDVHLIEFLKKVFFSGSTMPRCLIYSKELHLMV